MSFKDRDIIIYIVVVIATAIYVSYINKGPISNFDHSLSYDNIITFEGTEQHYILHNAGNHLYPYMASVTAMSCLLAVIFIIICLGANL